MPETNLNARLETFCDGVFAIAITLLILDIKVPPKDSYTSTAELMRYFSSHWTEWFAFGLSFISMFIAWVNHNHCFRQVDKTSPVFMYANGLLMLTVIIYPYVTSLLAEYLNTGNAQLPVLAYCLLNTIHAVAWVVLFYSMLRPSDLTKNEVCHKRAKETAISISYAAVFNAAMCIVAIWLPVVAVCLTALAWLVYLVMGIVLTPITD